jgi:hypothetical protein
VGTFGARSRSIGPAVLKDFFGLDLHDASVKVRVNDFGNEEVLMDIIIPIIITKQQYIKYLEDK